MRVHRLIGAGLAAVGCSLLPTSAGARVQSPTYVQVVEKEYSLTLSRLKVPHGTVIFQAINFGMDNHDLVIQPDRKGAKPITFKLMAPSERVTKTLQLAAGRYTLSCSVPGHRQYGMVARLSVS
ncbi:MAG TPA: plastocyanin/azurin family copper-binding protein [Gaiellaceae bacterium]|nr:plastocyanin/azurin family copper-binding protein [Gaiellaceae bacterium]